MYAKVLDPKRHGKVVYQNNGSAQRCINYLAQEAKAAQQQAVFFSSEGSGELTAEQVVQRIDSNRKGLTKDDPKFHSLVLSPSAEEVAQLSTDPQALQRYTRNVMELYAQNFTLRNGRQLHEQDLVWAATVHHERKHRGTEAGDQGTPKAGLQTHIHVLVSARDVEQKVTLNPHGKASRFNRVQFQAKANVQLEDELGFVAAPGMRAPSRQERVNAKARDIQQKAAEKAPRERKPLTPEQQAAKEKRLDVQVARVNAKLAPERQLDAERVKEVARERRFDNGFYGNLGQLERRAERGQHTPNPYEFLATGRLAGREQDTEQAKLPARLLRERTPAPAPARSLVRGMGHRLNQLARSIAPGSHTTDVRSEEEKRRDYEQGM